MASEPLLEVAEGKPRADRLIDIPSGSSEQLAAWMAAPPAKLATLEPGPGELAPPGPRTVQHRVDIPAEPGSDR
jgi:hypothetical protein